MSGADAWARMAGRATGHRMSIEATAPAATPRPADPAADLVEEVHEVVVHQTERHETTVVEQVRVQQTPDEEPPAPAVQPFPLPAAMAVTPHPPPELDSAPLPQRTGSRRQPDVHEAVTQPSSPPPLPSRPSRQPRPLAEPELPRPAPLTTASQRIERVVVPAPSVAAAQSPSRGRSARARGEDQDRAVAVPARPGAVSSAATVRLEERTENVAVPVAEQPLHITIGRVDVRTSRPPRPPLHPPEPESAAPTTPSLADYLAGRSTP